MGWCPFLYSPRIACSINRCIAWFEYECIKTRWVLFGILPREIPQTHTSFLCSSPVASLVEVLTFFLPYVAFHAQALLTKISRTMRILFTAHHDLSLRSYSNSRENGLCVSSIQPVNMLCKKLPLLSMPWHPHWFLVAYLTGIDVCPL